MGTVPERGAPERGAIVLHCRDLAANEAFFRELGFRLDTVFPADSPRQLELSGFGLRLCLHSSHDDHPGYLRLSGSAPRVLTAPNGTLVEFAANSEPNMRPAPPHFAVHRGAGGGLWHTGRAGMLYRDLVPDRLGGTTIVSHIRVPQGGPVPDYVHFHRVTAQALYVVRGSVQVVYEDQGGAFAMHAGDCVLQPPQIRHRVIACSDGFEVIEVACPAEHATVVEHDLTLPTVQRRPDRSFGGQRFHHHLAATATLANGPYAGFQYRDCGIGAASGGAIAMRVLAATAGTKSTTLPPAPQVRLWLPLCGEVTIAGERLAAGDACVLPAEHAWPVATPSHDLQVLEVLLALP